MDTYAIRWREDGGGPLTGTKDGYDVDDYVYAPDEDFAGVGPLVGGLFSGGTGSASFRGKTYAEYVGDVTDISLYAHEVIPPVVVAEMADDLERDSADPDGKWREHLPQGEARALAAWFRVAARHGYGIFNWW